jgi:hypothetical protein
MDWRVDSGHIISKSGAGWISIRYEQAGVDVSTANGEKGCKSSTLERIGAAAQAR